MLVVSDTSPLRALQAIGRVDLLGTMYGTIYTAPAVASELAVDAPGVGVFPLAAYPSIVVKAPTHVDQVRALLAELDRGEAEAIALALELKADWVLIDESSGRRIAALRGLRTLGVLALLVQAKRLGLVERVEPLLLTLDARIRFRISEQLRRARAR